MRQCGLTSPLFNLHVDDRGAEQHNVGCFIGNVCGNHSSYASHMVLLSLLIGGLMKLLVDCEGYALVHGLRHNEKKTAYMIFKADNKIPDTIPTLIINLVLKRVQQFQYLWLT